MTTLTIPHCTPIKEQAILSALRAWKATQPLFDDTIVIEQGEALSCEAAGEDYTRMLEVAKSVL
jgi:hypothetical protein